MNCNEACRPDLVLYTYPTLQGIFCELHGQYTSRYFIDDDGEEARLHYTEELLEPLFLEFSYGEEIENKRCGMQTLPVSK